jgi:hypothetical protein
MIATRHADTGIRPPHRQRSASQPAGPAQWCTHSPGCQIGEVAADPANLARWRTDAAQTIAAFLDRKAAAAARGLG